MEEWASVFGTRATRYDVKRLRKLLVKEHNRPPTEEESDTIVDKCRSAFYLHACHPRTMSSRKVSDATDVSPDNALEAQGNIENWF